MTYLFHQPIYVFKYKVYVFQTASIWDLLFLFNLTIPFEQDVYGIYIYCIYYNGWIYNCHFTTCLFVSSLSTALLLLQIFSVTHFFVDFYYVIWAYFLNGCSREYIMHYNSLQLTSKTQTFCFSFSSPHFVLSLLCVRSICSIYQQYNVIIIALYYLMPPFQRKKMINYFYIGFYNHSHTFSFLALFIITYGYTLPSGVTSCQRTFSTIFQARSSSNSCFYLCLSGSIYFVPIEVHFSLSEL